ncbi:kinase-like protein [Mucidula mucida]|nr:kinase-like protein [Mucidula mucida]
MTAKNRAMGFDVAVKFIIKEKVPDYAWVEDERYGRLPTEVFLLDYMDHDNIVKGLDLFQDHLFFYLVQELHAHQTKTLYQRILSYLPALSNPSVSADSFDDSTPVTPPIPSSSHVHLPLPPFTDLPQKHKSESLAHLTCIEQSVHKRLPEDQARYVFRQVVDAVHYLDSHGIAHRDIKDENIAIDKDLNVKLIDFGSSIYVDPTKPRPYYTLFYGTTAYAASEILMKSQVWTLGVLLSYLLHGMSPFPTAKDAMKGRIVLEERPRVSRHAYDLMRWCLDPNPLTRATIRDIQTHRWLDC